MEHSADNLTQQVHSNFEESLHNVFRLLNREFCTLILKLARELRETTLLSKDAESAPNCLLKEVNLKFNGLFTEDDIYDMILFAELFSGQLRPVAFIVMDFLSWSHIKQILHVREISQKDFYVNLVVSEALTVSELKSKIDSNYFEDVNTDVSSFTNSIFTPTDGKRNLSWTFNNVSESPNLYYNLVDEKLLRYLCYAKSQFEIKKNM
jgi:hypothetical protein